MSLTYEATEQGYTIFNNGIAWIVQSEYIPYPADTMEQAAQNHIDAILEDRQTQQDELMEIEQLKSKQVELEQAVDSILTDVLPALLGQ